MKVRLSVLSVVVALSAFQAPGVALAQRDPTGRWDAREFPREQREQRLRACADYKKGAGEKPVAIPGAAPAGKPVARSTVPPPCGRLKF